MISERNGPGLGAKPNTSSTLQMGMSVTKLSRDTTNSWLHANKHLLKRRLNTPDMFGVWPSRSIVARKEAEQQKFVHLTNLSNHTRSWQYDQTPVKKGSLNYAQPCCRDVGIIDFYSCCCQKKRQMGISNLTWKDQRLPVMHNSVATIECQHASNRAV